MGIISAFQYLDAVLGGERSVFRLLLRVLICVVGLRHFARTGWPMAVESGSTVSFP